LITVEERYPGQTVEAFLTSVAHTKNLVSVGLNCALGAKQMRPFVEDLSNASDKFLSVYPNAGLPNEMGGYDETPQTMASVLNDFLSKRICKYCWRMLRYNPGSHKRNCNRL
jgi:methionine synthase I (cobalamin-dependent)